MKNFTRGEWFVDAAHDIAADGIEIRDSAKPQSGKLIAAIFPQPDGEFAGNAELVKRAPKLLQAAGDFYDYLQMRAAGFDLSPGSLERYAEKIRKLTVDLPRIAGPTTSPKMNRDSDATIARAIAREMFEGRKGHGGGPCTRRVLRPDAIEAIALKAIRLSRREPTHEGETT